jgi:hypothetical protein
MGSKPNLTLPFLKIRVANMNKPTSANLRQNVWISVVRREQVSWPRPTSPNPAWKSKP